VFCTPATIDTALGGATSPGSAQTCDAATVVPDFAMHSSKARHGRCGRPPRHGEAQHLFLAEAIGELAAAMPIAKIETGAMRQRRIDVGFTIVERESA